MAGRHSVAATGGRHRAPAKPLPVAPAVLLFGAFAGLATAVPTSGTAVAVDPGPSALAPTLPPPVPAPAPAVLQPAKPSAALVAVRAALSKVGTPYLWGAKGPDRFDCSGLTQWSYRQAGVRLAEDTYRQIVEGRAVPVPEAGDLIFPSRGHVLLAISSTSAVEAPGRGLRVRVVPIPATATFRRVSE